MAGRIKHMERSHRSHNANYGVFNQFHARAYKVANLKQSRKTIGQTLSSLIKKMMPNTASK